MRLIEELREMATRRHKLVAELQELDATFDELKALVNGGGVPADSVRGKREARLGGEELAARRDRIVSVLGTRVMRAADIGRETDIAGTAIHSDLIALAAKGRVEKAANGWRVVGGASEGVRDAATPVPFSEPAPVGATN